jgi:hypothetical protein
MVERAAANGADDDDRFALAGSAVALAAGVTARG